MIKIVEKSKIKFLDFNYEYIKLINRLSNIKTYNLKFRIL